MSSRNSSDKTRVAVIFGGRSPEHDVSVVSGLQVLKAIDTTRYEAFPVYITLNGRWLIGDGLDDRKNFLPDANMEKYLTEVMLDTTAGKVGRLVPKKGGLFGGGKALEFDVAFPVFHGLHGEDGGVQGLFDVIGVAYCGMRTMATSLLMDKGATKNVLKGLGVPCLDYAVIPRPSKGYLVDREELAKLAEPVGFPCIVKPVHLGSSIGVAKANDLEELAACLPAIFEFDDSAIIEPFVENLVEYNVSASAFDGAVRTSAIERPKTTEELLDFKQKYLSGGDNKIGEGGTKTPGESSEGMLSLTREINPVLDGESEASIREWASEVFEALCGSGAPRFDFIGNQKTGEIWMNEVNPIPGSLGYFLWEAADPPMLFAEFLSAQIEEAKLLRKARLLPKDPVPVDARLLRRHT